MASLKLSDVQIILLATAVQREDGSLLPPPDSLGDRIPRIRTAIGGLLKRALVAEMMVTDTARAWREDGKARIGLAITAAGRAIIAVEEESSEEADKGLAPPSIPAPDAPPKPAAKPASKIAAVTAMLQRPRGATLAELVEATSWLPHTTRAALTGLRKKGHVLDKHDRDGATAYSIGTAA